MKMCDQVPGDQLLQGQLDARDEALCVQHLDVCETCRRRLEQLAGDNEQWAMVRDILSAAPETAEFAGGEPAWGLDRARRIDLKFLAPTDEPDMLGRMGGYEISGVIGAGGMGIVLKGFDRALNRNVAVKVLEPLLARDATARQRFAREARAMAAISHEQVVPVYAVDERSLPPYFVMEYVPGGTLERRLAAEGPLGVTEVVRVGLQVARGLAAAHRQGLVHRDIKPSNILLDRGVERVRVADFGLVRAQNDASQTRTGHVIGTPQYMSPEQVRGEPCDARSDLFSLGSVLYALCTGHPPFRSESVYAVLHRIAQHEPRSIREQNPEVPAWLEDFIRRLLQKDRDLRFQSAEEVGEFLEEELASIQNPLAVCEPARAWRAHEPAREPGTRTAPIAAEIPAPSSDSQRHAWLPFLHSPRALAMTLLSITGIVVASFALFSNDGPAVDSQQSNANLVESNQRAAEPAGGGQAPVAAPATQIAGVIKAVDADKNTLVVAEPDGDKTYTLAPDASIVVNGKAANSGGLRVGARITLSMFAGPSTTRRVVAVGPQLSGVVKAVDADKNSVTLTDDSAFVMTKNANISIDGKPGKLAELAPGALVTLSWFADQQTSRKIEAGGPAFQSVAVQAIDAQAGTITFGAAGQPADIAGKTLLVPADASVQIDGQPGRLPELTPGLSVDLNLSADRKSVRSLSAGGPTFQGVQIQTIDAAQNTIAIATDRQPPELAGRTLGFARGATIFIDDAPAGLTALPRGAIVNLSLSLDRKMVRSITAIGPGYFGIQVANVDAGNSRITVGLERQPVELAGKTMPVARDAYIEIDGRLSNLSTLIPGAHMDVMLSVDGTTMRRIHAQGPSFPSIPVKAVDVANGLVTFDVIGDDPQCVISGKTLPVARDARIWIDDGSATLAKLPPGTSISATLSMDRTMVRSITARGRQIGSFGDAIVLKVDMARNTVTVDINGQGERSFTVAKDARISVDGKPARLEAVPGEASVVLDLAIDGTTVRGIQAKSP